MLCNKALSTWHVVMLSDCWVLMDQSGFNKDTLTLSFSILGTEVQSYVAWQ